MMDNYELWPSDAMSIKKYLQHVNIQNTGHGIVIGKKVKKKYKKNMGIKLLYSFFAFLPFYVLNF